MTFGERLYKIRKDAGISQEQLAELMEVSRQSVSKWESDKAYPEMNRLIFLSDYFHVSLDYLMRGEEDSKPINNSLTIQWNTFLTNLNDKQKGMFIVLYTLVSIALVAIVLLIIYVLGYEFGRALYHLIH